MPIFNIQYNDDTGEHLLDLPSSGGGNGLSGTEFDETLAIGTANNTIRPLSFAAIPESIQLFINGVEYSRDLFSYNTATRIITWNPALFTLPASSTRFIAHIWYRTLDAVVPPNITGISPIAVTAGTTITITGTGFGGVQSVTIGGIPATIQSNTETQIVVTVPNAGATSSKPVVVTTNVPPLATSSINYTRPAPVIASFNPVSGSSGSTITITGQYFTGAMAVQVGGAAAASFTVNSDTSITAILGAVGTGNVSVTTVDGTGVLSGFTQQSLWTGLRTYWRFDETTTNGNRLNAVNPAQNILSLTGPMSSVPAGKIGNGLGSGTIGVLATTPPHSNLHLVNFDWSMSFWFRPILSDYTAYHQINYNFNIGWWQQGAIGTFYFQLYVTPFTPSSFFTLAVPGIASGQWHHVVITHNNANKTLRIYVNNVLRATQAYSTSPHNAGMGTMTFKDTSTFDEFGIWHRELSAGDVNILFNSGNGFPLP
jgi:hypothetical protein